jgi:poly(hydroxyalkanoate) granule-associated protein
MNKLDNIREKTNAAEDFARKIWLAGLGAYGKGYDEAKGRFEELNEDASKLFNDLVAKGETLEAEAKENFKEKQTELTDKADERIAKVRESLGLEKSDTEDKIDELSAKIDALTAVVEKLSKA